MSASPHRRPAEEWFAEHATSFLDVARRAARDLDPQDAVQEWLLAAHVDGKTFETLDDALRWGRTVVWRLARDAWRKGVALPTSRVPVPHVCVEVRHCADDDRLSIVTPDALRRVTGPLPGEGTGVAAEQVPLCALPNTPATRCDPGHRPSEGDRP